MPTPSTRMGLLVPDTSDDFVTGDIASNWNKLDAAPGIHICTSTTRPSWGAGQNRRLIMETDTGLLWQWFNSSSTWQRMASSGLLKKANGDPAITERDTDFTTTSTDEYKMVTSVSSVVVPSGRRPLLAMASWRRSANSAGTFQMAIYRSATANTGPIISQWVESEDAGGNTMFGLIRDGVVGGQYDFSIQAKSSTTFEGTSTINGDATTPITLAIFEF